MANTNLGQIYIIKCRSIGWLTKITAYNELNVNCTFFCRENERYYLFYTKWENAKNLQFNKNVYLCFEEDNLDDAKIILTLENINDNSTRTDATLML